MAENTLPKIKLNFRGQLKGLSEEGRLKFAYSPFVNLKVTDEMTGESASENDLSQLRLNANKSKIDSLSPIDINIEESYDGSANLILNDRLNAPKIVNSRFYLTGENKYKIGDRKGNIDTNIYTKQNFETEANLIKSVQSIVSVDFEGIFEGGRMPIGNYTFYFKLSDSDGNETDFIAESGKVICHIGGVNQPKYIRGGQINENSGKLIKLTLNNLDLAYNFITVYYTRSTGGDNQEITTARKINDKFKIDGINTKLTISGYEEHVDIDIAEINIKYTNFESVKTVANCQNITFMGNIQNNYDLFKLLERYSLLVTPEIVNSDGIGNLNEVYEETIDKANGYEYYNTKNIYYKLGYWDKEIYRLGIVYILNDYTLSPVFNIRGIKELSETVTWDGSSPYSLTTVDIKSEAGLDGIITKNDQNVKGLFRINYNDGYDIFKGKGETIRPVGIKVNFNNALFNSDFNSIDSLTKGFIIVRQRRIPTILAQAVGIATTRHGGLPVIRAMRSITPEYIIDSFLEKQGEDALLDYNPIVGLIMSRAKPKLGNSIYAIKTNNIIKNALLCPEATIRVSAYNNYFNSSEFTLETAKYQPDKPYFSKAKNSKHFCIPELTKNAGLTKFNASLLLVEPEIELIRNDENLFSSKAGDGLVAHKHIDVEYGDYSDPKNNISKIDAFNRSASKVRGIFNTYLGTNTDNIESNKYYNIFEKDYDFNKYWKDYFKIRANDNEPYFPIGDRISWNEVKNTKSSPVFYRGDCYINTYTHRMNWNFIDPEMPTNTQIVDPYTWYKHFRVINSASVVVNQSGGEESLAYNKLLPLYTYKGKDTAKLFDKDIDNVPNFTVLDPENKSFKKYSEYNGLFGYEKMNRPDINAVGLGHWVTFKICSNVNLAMRDVDMSRPMEEAVHKMKRSFYPLQSMEQKINLPESNILNSGISKTTGDKYYFNTGDVPFIKTSFPTRIYYSNILQQSAFVNGNRIFLSKNFKDYSLEYGALIKLVEWYGTLIAIMEHGILMIPVNERAMMTNESGENVYINTDNVLPANPKVLSNTFGSLWADSILETSRYIYGIDTVAKKIWRTNGEVFEIISDLKIQKFLNDNINLAEIERDSINFTKSIKTHYNAFKHDVLFVFNYGKNRWNLCWNEMLEKWVTRYTWFPEFSENINNIFYTFANKIIHPNAKNYLYKHGFAGTSEEKGNILPTKWYEEQHPFEFEFIVNEAQGVQKIFNNLKIVSNRTEPNSFIFETVGDGFEWADQKQDILDLNKTASSEEDSNIVGLGYPFGLIL